MKDIFRKSIDYLNYKYNMYGRYRYRKSDNYNNRRLFDKMEAVQLAVGNLNAKSIHNCSSIQEAEFKVFSQGGEDEIIQYLINKINIENETFVEFGVEDYCESNTRFLLQNNYWRGLIIDSGDRHIKFIENSNNMCQYDVEAITGFITTENINKLIKISGYSGDIGLLSIDVDGNDYWILKEVEVVRPRILIVEYNSLFGDKYSITVPYEPNFSISNAHYSELYYGASLKAIVVLAQQKGYQFVGCNKGGFNAFFIRNDVLNDLPTYTVKDGYQKCGSRLSRNEKGRKVFCNYKKQLQTIKNLPVYEIQNKKEVLIKDLFAI